MKHEQDRKLEVYACTQARNFAWALFLGLKFKEVLPAERFGKHCGRLSRSPMAAVKQPAVG